MKCISCEVEINPQWQHAIDMNVCPFCGSHIMEEHLKNLFSSLRETMDALQAYPDQVNDWMLSNHKYIKVDSPNIGDYMPKDMIKELKKIEDDEDFQKRKAGQKFMVKVQTEDGEQEVESEKIQSEERTNEFFQRAGLIKSHNPNAPPGSANFQSPAEKTQYLKKVAQQIKRAGAPSLNDGGVNSMISPDMLANADPEAIAEFQSMMSGGEVVSSLESSVDDDAIPAAVLAMAAKGKSGGGSNAGDLMKLQQMQDRVKKSREAFESGENRGGKGGGFSRA